MNYSFGLAKEKLNLKREKLSSPIMQRDRGFIGSSCRERGFYSDFCLC